MLSSICWNIRCHFTRSVYTLINTIWLQWVYILDVVHQLLCWCGISSVDPALTAEVVLRLGLVLESSAHLDQMEGRARHLLTKLLGLYSQNDLSQICMHYLLLLVFFLMLPIFSLAKSNIFNLIY